MSGIQTTERICMNHKKFFQEDTFTIKLRPFQVNFPRPDRWSLLQVFADLAHSFSKLVDHGQLAKCSRLHQAGTAKKEKVVESMNKTDFCSFSENVR